MLTIREYTRVRTMSDIHDVRPLHPIDFRQWIDSNRHLLRPPVGNKLVYQDSEFIVMAVGGPNSRKDFHVDPGEEFFYQLEGEITLVTVQRGKRVDVKIGEGEIFLLPSNMPHSPRRPADTVGLVIERTRNPGELDGFQWYCENCGHKLYEEFIQVTDIETQLPPVFDRFFGTRANRTCRNCGTVMDKPA
jgi:3-hydroxyanthranilate 3,4-dioxygenase